MQPTAASRKLRLIIILAVTALVLILLVVAGVKIDRHGKSETNLEVAPSTATLTIDGKTVKPGTVYLRPGLHTAVAKLDNFTDSSQTFTSIAGKSAEIGLVLDPANDAGKQYLSDNPTYQLEREGIGGQESSGRAALDVTPLRAALPTSRVDINGSYMINYGDSLTQKNGTVIIISDSSPKGRARAVQWIRDQGYDPTDLEIQYDDFLNPFSAASQGLGDD